MTFFHTTCSIYFLQIFLNLSDLAILQTEISIINFEEYGNTLSMCRHLNSWSFSIIAMALGNFVTLVPRMSKILKFCKFLILSVQNLDEQQLMDTPVMLVDELQQRALVAGPQQPPIDK